MNVLNYGGGIQSVALCLLIEQGAIKRPDMIIIADTGREKPTTWTYLAEHIQPRMTAIGLPIHIAGHDLAYLDLYDKHDGVLLPAFSEAGKLRTFCSSVWKEEVVSKYLADRYGLKRREYVHWIGYSLDEKHRAAKGEVEPGTEIHNLGRGRRRRYPLVESMITRMDCMTLIHAVGLPLPQKSSCWMCPHMRNDEWRSIRDTMPDYWEKAIALDAEIREVNYRGPVFLHASRKPLNEAPIDAPDTREEDRQCALGLCFL